MSKKNTETFSEHYEKVNRKVLDEMDYLILYAMFVKACATHADITTISAMQDTLHSMEWKVDSEFVEHIKYMMWETSYGRRF